MIVSVDGHSIAGVELDQVDRMIKGPEGTEVTVGVRQGRQRQGRGS